MIRTKYIPDILCKKYDAAFCRESEKEMMSFKTGKAKVNTLLPVVDSYFNLLYERTTGLTEE